MSSTARCGFFRPADLPMLPLASCRRLLLLVRGIFGFGAIGNYFWAVTLLPLNEAMVLSFTAPVWASLLGPFLIKEVPQK